MMTGPRWRGVSAVLTGLAVAVSVPWAFGYLLPQGGTRAIGLAGLAGYSPYALFLVLLVAWALRRWLALAVCAALMTGQAATLGPAYVGDGSPTAGRSVLRMMTVNLYFGSADAGQVVRLVRAHRIDVLALEELSPGAVVDLERAGLRAELPYAVNHAAVGAQGTGLWSRLPLTEVPSVQLRFHSGAADLRVGGGLVRVRALHPVTPVPTSTGWRRDFGLLRTQAEADVGIATILIGDLNASVHHRELRRLMSHRWRDAGEADGAGLVRTWTPRRGAWSVLDLDHVLIDRGMTVDSFETVPIRGSDHRAVIAAVAVQHRT
jgi:endonuclease/exonuclease/phosphatase (EEP) superfamily protein YafD